MTELEKKIFEMKQNFFDCNGKNPTKIYIPNNKKNEFALIDGYPINKDVNEHFKSIQGLEIIWDAKEFKVE